MTHPRMAIPGATYLVTRTTVMSLFLLTPSQTVNQIMEYCIAWAAHGRGILVHAISVESNHFHLVVTDVEGRLSDFMQELNRCAARCLLEHYRERYPKRRIETVWTNAQSFSATLLLTSGAVLDKVVYTLTNPVKDGLVRDYREWPGLNTTPDNWREGSRVAPRPRYFFKHTPEALEYAVCAPSQLGPSVEHAIKAVELHIREVQHQAANDLIAQRRTALGVSAVLAVHPFDAPTTERPTGNLNPHLAAAGDPAAFSAAKVALKLFRMAYREAWERFKVTASAVFPGGTWLMHRRYLQSCTPLDACWCLRAA